MRGIKNNNYFLIYILLLLCVESSLTIFKIVVAEKEDCTDLARDEETLLVFSTLGGGLTAIDPLSSEIRWTIADEPAVKSIHKDDFTLPQYLPDPRDGSLYQLGNMGDLKKLPYTIPELVANAPCRSSDGILYSGKKSDTWFLIDPKTGRRKKLMGFGGGGGGTSNGFNNNQNQNQQNGKYDDETIGWATSRSIYLGRTQYTVLMYDSLSKEKSTKPWNITFYDYASHSMAPEISKEYEYLHLAGSSSGLIVTLDRQQGKLIWQKDLSSPVIAVFLLSSEGLLSVPFTTVSDEALHSIIEEAKTGGINEVKLFQSLYVGEHLHGLYAIPSLVDKDTPTMSSTPSAKLIEGDGPINDSTDRMKDNEKQEQKQNSNRKLVYIDKLLEKQNNVIVLGHYGVPKVTDEIELKISATNRKFIDNKQLSTIANLDLIQGNKDFILIDGIRTNTVGIQTDPENIVNDDNDDDDDDVVNNNDRKNLNKSRKNRIPTTNSSTSTTSKSKSQTSDTGKKVIIKIFDDSKAWLTDQQSGRTHQILIVLILSVIGMFWYTCSTVRELRQNSQNGSNSTNRSSNNSGSNMNCQELIDLGNGEIKVGKITFNCNEVLGKGCEGTFVFRGSFEKRDVAVKRLLPECFSFADREVTLLRESDAHENVVRYFCTEQDRQFRYIAVELCAATLQDYTVGDISKELREKIDVWNVLQQATNGLAHLHSLNIVHRDIKPQNVLLSLPDINNRVRVMISDFGLCKKLNHGKTSFSRRSGITGTEGWIAPEMIKGQRTTTSVDIFSLGCVYYYVLTEGDHAFGDNLKRQANILSNEFDLKKLTSGDEMHSQLILAEQLIADMIHYDAQKRPTARAICNHPMFWNEEKILSFLQDVSDRVEKLMYTIEPLRTLEKNGKFIVRDDWNLHLETAITDDLRKYRGYTGISVRDLLRAIRNKRHHYHELSIKAQTTLGNIPQEFTNYWIKKFPYLLSHTYHALRICSKENPFKSYYDNNYNFSLPKYFYDDNCESPLVLENYLKLNNNNNYKNNNSGNNSNNNNNNNNSNSHHNHYHHGSPRKYLLEKIQKSHKGSYNFHRNQNQNQQQNYGAGVNNADNLQKISEEITRGGGREGGGGGGGEGGGEEKYEGDAGEAAGGGGIGGVGANNFEKRNNFTNFRFRNKSRAGQKQIQKNVTWIMND